MKFIDICAGIGGFRSGLEKAGHECIGYVEIDKYARKSYEAIYDTQDEWTATDITAVKAEEIPKADLWCFGFPCQDISVSGKQKGLKGERSGIFYSIIELLKSQNTENKPGWLLIENVKNLLSIHGGQDFTEVLSEISEAGYDCEWVLLNSKDFGVPQNRERVFIIGYLRNRSRSKILSESGTSEQIDKEVETNRINTHIYSYRQKEEPELKRVLDGNQADRVYNSEGLSKTLTGKSGGGGAKTGYYTVPKINTLKQGKYSQDIILKQNSISRAITSRDYKGAQNIAIPCLTPNRINKSQNGRRFKENGDPMFTLAAQDQHGVLLYDGKEYHIRKLTPKECFRLQGFSDEQFEKAQAVNSNTQLYKQAGNAVTVNVAQFLGERLKQAEGV